MAQQQRISAIALPSNNEDPPECRLGRRRGRPAEWQCEPHGGLGRLTAALSSASFVLAAAAPQSISAARARIVVPNPRSACLEHASSLGKRPCEFRSWPCRILGVCAQHGCSRRGREPRRVAPAPRAPAPPARGRVTRSRRSPLRLLASGVVSIARRQASAAAPGAPRARAARATPTIAEETCASGPSPPAARCQAARSASPAWLHARASASCAIRRCAGSATATAAATASGCENRGRPASRCRSPQPTAASIEPGAIPSSASACCMTGAGACSSALKRTSAKRACGARHNARRTNASSTLADALKRSVRGTAPAICSGESSRAASRSHSGCPPLAEASSCETDFSTRDPATSSTSATASAASKPATVNDSRSSSTSDADNSLRVAKRNPIRSASRRRAANRSAPRLAASTHGASSTTTRTGASSAAIASRSNVATATANGSARSVAAIRNAPRNASRRATSSRSSRPSSNGESTSNRPP